jgi:uncharacterized protein YeaO (DUF488 family)
MFAIQRVYEPAQSADGRRVLVERLWPRGITRQRAAVALWLKEIAPSAELRKWFSHDPQHNSALLLKEFLEDQDSGA